MWVVLLHRSVQLEKCQKLIPRNVMSIKNNFITTLTLIDTTGGRTGKFTIIDRAENVLDLGRRVIGNTGLIPLFLMS